MSIEKLKSDLAIAEKDLIEATAAADKSTGGPAKVKAKKLVIAVETKITELKGEIETLEIAAKANLEGNKPNPEDKDNLEGNKPNPEDKDNLEGSEKQNKSPVKLAEVKDGEIVIVKNIGRFMLHGMGVRFPSGIEVKAEMNDYIRGNALANIFVGVNK